MEIETEQVPAIPDEFIYLNHDEPSKETVILQDDLNGGTSGKLNGLEVENDERPQNGAEAYKNLVKSLEEDCESDYLVKDITDDTQIDENFGGLMGLEFGFNNRESEGLFQ